MTEQEAYEKYARDYAEASSEYSHALLQEIAKGTETDAPLRKQLAETRVPAHILSDLWRASENFEAARAAMGARGVIALERAAEAQQRSSSWAASYQRGGQAVE